MLELQVRMTCPHCLPSAYLLFCLLLTCHLPKTPDIISHWPYLRQTPLFLAAREGASHKHLTQLCCHTFSWLHGVCADKCYFVVFSVCIPSFCFHRVLLFLDWKLFFTWTALTWCVYISHYNHIWSYSCGGKTQYNFLRERFLLYKFKIKWPYNKFQQANGKDLYGSNRKRWFLNATNQ